MTLMMIIIPNENKVLNLKEHDTQDTDDNSANKLKI